MCNDMEGSPGHIVNSKTGSYRTIHIDVIPFTLKMNLGVSLVAQWLRICLPMQGTRVKALVWEDPTCRGATRPVSHNC